jgi:hypothetical protein
VVATTSVTFLDLGLDNNSTTGSISATMETMSSDAQTYLSSTNDPNAPTAYPTKLGSPIYYGDFRTTSCQNVNDLLEKPDWITEEFMYKSKEECCKEAFSWAPLENCLGIGFVETNYVVGSRSPTLSPTTTPTTLPSLSPSESLMPIYAPSFIPSILSTSNSSSPVQDSSLLEHASSSEAVETITQNSEALSTSSHNPDNNFLVELLGWANSDMDTLYPEGPTVAQPAPSPVVQDDQISELTIDAFEDATLSRDRPDANFGGNTALAVDGGAEGAECFDSLLKFDLGMIDSTRELDSAVLKIYAVADCLGSAFSTTADSDWKQKEVTWNKAPSVSRGVMFGELKDVRQNAWYELDISTALYWYDNLVANSTGSFLSIRITSKENSRCLYSGMEGDGSKAPILVIKYFAPFSVGSEVDDPSPVAPPGQFVLLLADADTTLSASNPTSVLSNEHSLKVEFNPVTRNIHDTLIRFNLSQIGGASPRSAILSLFSEMDCSSAGTIATTQDSDWEEATITWTTSPNYDPSDMYDGGFMIGTYGAVSRNRWYGFDVVQAIVKALLGKKKEVTFRISSGNTGTCQFSSKESGREPKLMVAF